MHNTIVLQNIFWDCNSSIYFCYLVTFPLLALPWVISYLVCQIYFDLVFENLFKKLTGSIG